MAAVAAASGCAAAQAADNPVQLLPIDVIGTQQSQTGDVIDEEHSVSTSSVSYADLNRANTTLAEIIAREAGVQYQQSGGFGSYASISIRAASAAQTGVYLNGVLLNSGGNPVVDLSTLEILNLESVNIYRGGTPLQLGHAGIGGALNLNTLSAGSEPLTRFRAGLGSYSDRSLQLSHQSINGQWDLLTAASYRESANDFTFLNDNGTPLNPTDDERQKRNNAWAQRSSLLLQAGYRHDKNTRTDLTIQAASRSLGVPHWRNRPDNSASYDTLSSQFQLSHVRNRIKNWNTRHIAYWHTDDTHYQDRLGQVGLGSQNRYADTQTYGLKTYWEHPTKSGFAALSLDFRREILDSTDRLDVPADYSAERDGWLAVLHHTWFDKTDKWTVTPAIRWQHSALSGTGANTAEGFTERSEYSRAGAQLGVSYEPVKGLQAFANLGSYYRTPSFGELYGSIGLINGNAALDPEKGINTDLGIQWQTSQVTLGSTLFASDRDELIVTAFDSRGVGRPVNSGKAKVYGLELSALWNIKRLWTIRSDITWQSAKSVDRRSGFSGNHLPGEAQLAWFVRTQYSPSRWTFWHEADLQRKRFFDRANILPAADTTQHSIGLGWQSPQWNINFGIRNLNNANVEDFNGFPKPGRQWSLTLTRIM